MADANEVSLAGATAAPVEHKIGSDTYRFSPLHLREFGELESLAKQRIVSAGVAAAADVDRIYAEALAKLDPGLKPHEHKKASEALDIQKERVIRSVIAAAHDKATYTNASTAEVLFSAASAFDMLLLSVRRLHPDMTREKLMGLLEDNAVDVSPIVRDIKRLTEIGGPFRTEGK
jgi:hypothetical protein